MDYDAIEKILQCARERGISLWAKEGELRFRDPGNAMTEALRDAIKGHKSEIVDIVSGPVFRARGGALRVPVPAYREEFIGYIRRGVLDVDYTNRTKEVYKVRAPIDLTVLSAVVQKIVDRHKILGCRIVSSPGGEDYVFSEAPNVDVVFKDLSQDKGPDKLARARDLASEIVWAPFDLENGPLFRPFVIKISRYSSIFGFVIHHLIADLAAVRIVRNEIISLYFQMAKTGQGFLPDTALQYSDYAIAMREWVDGAGGQFSREFWNRQLHDAPETRLPSKAASAPADSAGVGTCSFFIDSAILQDVVRFAKTQKITLFSLVLALKIIALFGSTGRDDVMLKIICSGRFDHRIMDMVGDTANQIMLRLSQFGDLAFMAFLEKVHQVLLKSYEHQMFPDSLMRARLAEAGIPDRSPLINYIDRTIETAAARPSQGQQPGLYQRMEKIVENFDVIPCPEYGRNFENYTMEITHEKDVMYGHIKYSRDIYQDDVVEKFVSTFTELFGKIGTISENRLLSTPVSRLNSESMEQ